MKLVVLSPECDSAADMLALSRRLIADGVRWLHLTFHSSSLRPGLTPFAPTRSDVERVYATIETFVAGLSAMARVAFATVAEGAEALAPATAPSHGGER